MMSLITRLLIVVLGILFVAYIVPGIIVDGFYTALIVALILGLLNIVVRPILILLTLPITLITFGLFTFVINALIFWFVASFVQGFYVDGFLAAFIGALIVSIISSVGNKFI